MKTFIAIFVLSLPVFVFAKSKGPAWELLMSQDDIKIEKFQENAPNGQHNKFNFLVRFTDAKTGKQTTQALIKDYQEDWLESHSEYTFNDGVLKITVNGVDGIDKGNGVIEQKPFKLEKCFKLNAASTAFSPAKCD
jgi:hypothetical protein